jgi:hypothetical protein
MKSIPTKAWAVVAGTILLCSAVLIFRFGFQSDDVATRFSAIVLVGLALTVVFMAILAIIYSVMGVDDPKQALALPEGSIRALLAFSLVLIFVCLGSFLFSEVNAPCKDCAKILARVNDAQLADLKNNFLVAAELATDDKGKALYEQIPDPQDPSKPPVDDLKHPLYKVSYSPKPNPAAIDFAKQIFTTLATIFVSVVSFYFGSSVTTSAAAAGAKAARGSDTDKKSVALNASLTGALADSHNAQAACDKAAAHLKELTESHASQPEIDAAQTVLNQAADDLKAKQAKVQAAQDTLNATRVGNSPGATVN